MIRILAFIVPPILGLFRLGGGSYINSPIAKPFFFAITKNSAPKVSPPFKSNSGTISFLKALKLEKVSCTPTSRPRVLDAIFSEIREANSARLPPIENSRAPFSIPICAQDCFPNPHLS